MSFLLLFSGSAEEDTGFSPLDIPGLALWLDASDANTISVGAATRVSEWRDKSGNNNHADQSTTGFRPVTSTRTLNSKNVIDFDGTSQYLNIAATLNAIGAGANTVFIVYASDNTGDAQQRLVIGSNGSGGPRYGVDFSTTALRVINRATDATYTTQSLTRDTETHIAGFYRSGVNITPFVDGVEGTAGTNCVDFTASGNIRIGANTSSTERFNGVIAEIVIYSAALTLAERQQVGVYLAAKWSAPWASSNTGKVFFGWPFFFTQA